MDLALHTLGKLSSPDDTNLPPSNEGGVAALSPSFGLSLLLPGREQSILPLGTHKVASTAALDLQGRVVYAALAQPSEGCVAVLDTGAVRAPRIVRVADASFGPVSQLAAVAGESGVVASATVNGSVSLLRARASDGETIEVFQNVVKLNSDEVVAADSGVPGFVAFLARRGNRYGLHILKVEPVEEGDADRKESVDSAKEGPILDTSAALGADIFDVAWLPQTKRGDAVVGLAVTPRSVWVLYSSGEVHVFMPRFGFDEEKHGDTLEAWRESYDKEKFQDQSSRKRPKKEKTTPGSRRHRKSNPQGPCGSEVDGQSGRGEQQTKTSEDVEGQISKGLEAGEAENEGKQGTGGPRVSKRWKNSSLSLCFTYRARHVMVLRPRAISSEGSVPPSSRRLRGGVAYVGGGYVVVGYGHILSVWDGEYGSGHGFVELTSNVTSVARGAADGEAVVLTSSGELYSVTLGSDENVQVASLALAVKRQGACSAILEDSEAAALKPLAAPRQPLHAQPVAVGPLKATADAGDTSGHLFDAHIKVEEKEDERRLRQVLSTELTPSASKVAETVGLYIFGNNSVRAKRERLLDRGVNVDPKALNRERMVLDRLPSERLAAAVVARCLRELNADKLDFLIPLIDLTSCGVVSSDLVVAVMTEMEASAVLAAAAARVGASGNNTKERNVPHVPASMTGPLTRSHRTTYALEAFLLRVVDLSEHDIVRTVQFAVRLREQAMAECASADAVVAKPLPRKIQRQTVKSSNRKVSERSRQWSESHKKNPSSERGSTQEDSLKEKLEKTQDGLDREYAAAVAKYDEARAEQEKARKVAIEAKSKLQRAERLLARCVCSSTDIERLSMALRRIPPRDVTSILRYCYDVIQSYTFAARSCKFVRKGLSRTAPTSAHGKDRRRNKKKGPGGTSDPTGVEPSEGNRTSCPSGVERNSLDPSTYRGVLDWLNTPLLGDSASGDSARESALLQSRCMAWVGILIEKHMATLAIDDIGSELLSRVLRSVKAHRQRAESVSSLIGMVDHLGQSGPLPDEQDPLYSVCEVPVPSFAALL